MTDEEIDVLPTTAMQGLGQTYNNNYSNHISIKYHFIQSII
jgi:hypothetical protein